MGSMIVVSGFTKIEWGASHSVPTAQAKLKSFSAKIVQLLKEWTEAFPYDFQDEKALGELKAIAYRVTQCDEVGVEMVSSGRGGQGTAPEVSTVTQGFTGLHHTPRVLGGVHIQQPWASLGPGVGRMHAGQGGVSPWWVGPGDTFIVPSGRRTAQ